MVDEIAGGLEPCLVSLLIALCGDARFGWLVVGAWPGAPQFTQHG
jgi:hypothetical protein